MWWIACTTPVQIVAEPVVGGIELHATEPIDLATLVVDGEPRAMARPPAPTVDVLVPGVLPTGSSVVVEVHLASGELREVTVVVPDLPIWIEVELPAGRAPVAVGDGDVLDAIGPADADALVRVTAREPTDVRIGERTWTLVAPGSQAEAVVPVGEVRVEAGDASATVSTHLSDPGPDALRDALILGDQVFPADRRGRSDPTLPANEIVLPGALGDLAERRLGVGYRPRHDLAPWAFAGVELRSGLDQDLDVALTTEVLRSDGAPDPAFASPDGAPPIVVVRVPARGEVTAALPVWVDPHLVRPGAYVREVRARPLGLDEAVRIERAPLVVVRGSAALELGFLVSLALGIAGMLALWRGAPRFLRTTPVRDQVTIALFGAATFVVGGGFQLLGYALATALGPFAPFVSGLFDDAFRAVLLATLLQQVPRPGVIGAATAVGFLMRALALGSFHPADLVYLGTQVLLGEATAWLAGLTRDPSWVDRGRVSRWLRLSAGLAPANAIAAGLGLASTAVLYRLWWAPAYVAALVLLPGFVYVVIGCWLAVPVAESLRRVAP
ncbi:MAG: hypothetical protein H6735_05335 [Alphaproteobacteria bacterium]|nr:hypothetical protein [Alphaproteobacteria bacterium]